MNDNLKFNICNLDHNEQHVSITQLLDRTLNSISPHLAYACTYWASHLVAGLDGDMELNNEVDELIERSATRHLLHWLEVLSFIGRVDMACSSLDMIHTAMVSDTFTTLINTACSINMTPRNRSGRSMRQ
jgi:hypothetical protein